MNDTVGPFTKNIVRVANQHQNTHKTQNTRKHTINWIRIFLKETQGDSFSFFLAVNRPPCYSNSARRIRPWRGKK